MTLQIPGQANINWNRAVPLAHPVVLNKGSHQLEILGGLSNVEHAACLIAGSLMIGKMSEMQDAMIHDTNEVMDSVANTAAALAAKVLGASRQLEAKMAQHAQKSQQAMQGQ